jgi:hypothetical protein
MTGRVLIVCDANKGRAKRCRRILAESDGRDLHVRPDIWWAPTATSLRIECPSHGRVEISGDELAAKKREALTGAEVELRVRPARLKPPT